MYERRELLFERDGETTRLLSPGVGEFTCAIGPGGMLGPGQDAGVLIVTGRSYFLRVPDGVSGRVQNALPGRIHEPVGYRTVLYELAPISAEAAAAADEDLRARHLPGDRRAAFAGEGGQGPRRRRRGDAGGRAADRGRGPLTSGEAVLR